MVHPFSIVYKYSPIFITLSFLITLFSCNIWSKQSSKSNEAQISAYNNTHNSILYDIDSNSYPIFQIENQLWMGSNLRVSRYNNEVPIFQLSSDNTPNKDETEGMFTWFDYKTDNDTVYGKLYNQYAVKEGSLCPTGWHVPSVDEWQIMINNLDGKENVGNLKLSENSIEFYVEYGGSMIQENILSPFSYLGKKGYWWTSTSVGRNTSNIFMISKDDEVLHKSGANDRNFLSVRCVKTKD